MIANLLIPSIGVLLVAGIVLAKRAQSTRRMREMRTLAGRMGWSFQAQPSLGIVPERKRFGLFTAGMDQRITNHLSGTVGEYHVSVFDLELAAPGRDGGVRTSVQTVARIHVPPMELPSIAVRPETVFHRSGDRLGGDIDFDADPEFSHAYSLRGPDRSAIRALFGKDVRGIFHRHPGSSADIDGDVLMLWRRGQVVPANDVPALAQTALDLATGLRRAAIHAGV